MRSGWVDRDAETIVAHAAKSGVEHVLALRIYTTRLLGRDPTLALHGGGNTSLKTHAVDHLGEKVEVLRVKGSGADMAAIEAEDLPAVRLDALRRLRALEAIGDDELLAIERVNLIDPAAPNPSVEIMLHAFLPHKFVDHTHATAVLSLIDQPDGAARCAEVFKDRLAFVPYLMPGFGLAKKAIDVFELAKPSDGLVLGKHGIVTFGESAREAYERMIEMVSLAEDFVARHRKAVAVTVPAAGNVAQLAAVAPIVRGACSAKNDKIEGAWRRLVLEFRSGDAILDFFKAEEREQVRRQLAATLRGVICQRMITTVENTMTPALEILINSPLVKKMIEENRLDKLAAAIETSVDDGMITFNQSLFNLVKSGRVSEKEALAKATNPQALEMNFKGIFLNEGGRIVS